MYLLNALLDYLTLIRGISMTNVIKKSISPICEINPTIQDRNKAVYHLYGSSKACGGFIFVRASHILVPAIYAVFNLARGSCSACFNFPYSRLAPNTTIHVFRGGGRHIAARAWHFHAPVA